jgi:hypothetical protein
MRIKTNEDLTSDKFRPIPFFRRYVIDCEGNVYNVKTKNMLRYTRFTNFEISLTDDDGISTTRTKNKLLELTWLKK